MLIGVCVLMYKLYHKSSIMKDELTLQIISFTCNRIMLIFHTVYVLQTCSKLLLIDLQTSRKQGQTFIFETVKSYMGKRHQIYMNPPKFILKHLKHVFCFVLAIVNSIETQLNKQFDKRHELTSLHSREFVKLALLISYHSLSLKSPL